jgi:pyrimidine-nucleoside phosphorylase
MSLLASILHKRDGGTLAPAAIEEFVAAAAAKEGATSPAPDYQLAALLMAIYFRGLDAGETAALTSAMVRSGHVLALPDLPGVAIDKHSTGGVGDKISLPLAPAVAACGGHVPMISGRSLGHTGGTLDKLESIPGFCVGLTEAAIGAQVAAIGLAFGAATDDLAPADRKLYALRDVTGTVESIPLITASILSKKIASGIASLVLDVKTGSGAFLRDRDDARVLARSLVATATRLGLETVAWITDMDEPLGRHVGNSLEIAETVATLEGRGEPDVVALVRRLGGEMLVAAKIAADLRDGEERIGNSLADGSALARFRVAVAAQGGDRRVIDDPTRLPRAKHVDTILAPRAGIVQRVDARAIGVAATLLGAGRQTVADRVDPGAGVVLRRIRGERVEAGEVLAEVHHGDASKFAAQRERIATAFAIGDGAPPPREICLERLSAADIGAN